MFFRSFFLLAFFSFLLASGAAQTAEERTFEKMADDLVYQLERSNAKRIAVIRFSYEGDDQTRIGEYFANEFSYAINQKRPSFNVMHRTDVENGMQAHYEKEKQEQRKAPNPLFVDNAAGTSELNYDAIGDGLVDLFSNTKMLKGVDVIVRGRIVDDGEEVTVSFSATKKKNTLASGRGRFSKTPKMRGMMERPVAVSNTEQSGGVSEFTSRGGSGSGTYGGGTQPVVWENANILVEISGCRQNGRDVECDLNFAAKDKDLKITIHPNFITLFSAANGHEFHPSELVIGDKAGTGWVNKDIFAHNSVLGKVTFNTITHEMNTIASLVMKGKDGLGKIEVQLRNVPVR